MRDRRPPMVLPMRRFVLALVIVALAAGACGSDDDQTGASDATTSCPVDDPNCGDDVSAVAPPIDGSIALPDEGPISISFGCFFYAQGEQAQLCDSLAESFPPQCGNSIIELEAPFEVVLDHVRESFGDPDQARLNTEQDVWWTDEWINLSGILENGKLLLEG